MRRVSAVSVLGVVVAVVLGGCATAGGAEAAGGGQEGDAARSEMIGKPAPPWVVSQWINLPDGKQTLDIADFKGKVLYLCFFQTTCPGSQSHALPTLKALTAHYAGNTSVAFVAVQTAFREFDANTPEKLSETAKRFGLKIPIGHEGAEGRPPQMLIRHKARGTPWAVIVDRKGTIRHSRHFMPTDRAVAIIDQYTGKPKTEGDTTPRPRGPFDLGPEEPVDLSPAGERIKERIDAIDKQIVGLLEEEMDLKMGIMNAKQKSMQLVKDTNTAAKEIAKGQLTEPLRAYKAIMVACVRKYQAYDAKYAVFQRTLKGMARSRAANEVQKELDALNEQILTRRRSNMDQIAGLLEKAGEFKKAVEIYSQLRDLLPKDKKKDTALARRTLQEKIGAAYENCEEYQKSVDAYNKVYEAMSAAERKGEINLRLKLGNLYQRVGNLKKALSLYKEVKKDLKPGQIVTGLDQIIQKLEARMD